MLIITVPGEELFNNEKQEFYSTEEFVLELEHSLVALSKWESKWKKPFIESAGDRTPDESLDYLRCMTLTPDVPPEVFQRLNQKNLDAVAEYIDDKMTATWFNDTNAPKSSEIITNELVYHWMIEFGIPIECETWHLNRLFTLIRVRNAKLAKPEKMKPADAAARRALNKQRREQYNTKG